MNNLHYFSSLKRDRYLSEIQQTVFDVLIIGGGITGAGIALDASSRGLKVLLIEQNDFASGTSSRSTKLVHGGLRYLEKLQFKFVADLGRERKILHENAAHNVIPTSVILPIVKGGQLNKPLTYLALWLYDRLAGVKLEYRARWISNQKLLDKYPYLESNGLKGAFLYNEYKTNDGRLVIETLKKAAEYGSISLNYMQLTELLFSNGKVSGARVTDSLLHQEIQVQAKFIINATGPWCEQFMKTYDSPMEKSQYLTKGVHIVFSKQRFPLNEAFYFDTFDKRMVFAIPRQDHVYVGTTDTPYHGELRHPIASDADVSYLLKAVNHKFVGLNLLNTDILSCWAGIRPLIKGNGKRPGEISRKEEVFESPSGLLSITGGKLTGYRLMAKHLVDKVMKKMDKPFVPCITKQIRLSGSNWEITPDIHKLIEFADSKFDEAKQTGISPALFKKLFYRYGTNIDVITEKAYEYRNQTEHTELIWLKAELWYAVNYEMVSTLADFCIYRTEMVLFESHSLNQQLDFIANTLAEFLNWNIEQRNLHLTKFNELWKEYQI